MIARLRVMVLLTRPAVALLLAVYAAVGIAEAGGTGGAGDAVPLARVLAAVMGFLLFSVACNDLADEAVDRVNLPGERRRPLVTGSATRRDLVLIAATAGSVALAASAAVGWPAVLVMVAGLGLSAAYSLPPARIAHRGVLASLLLPACYVAVPYLLGVLAARPAPVAADLLPLAALYVGFIGRILLKDFRDVRGDAPFGKRTFLVRHGRGWTCRLSAGCWTAGTVSLLLTAHRPTVALAAALLGYLAIALVLLRLLAGNRHPHRDEALVNGLAITGRATLVVLLTHLTVTAAGWHAGPAAAVTALLAVLMAGQALSMARRRGPGRTRPVRGTDSVLAGSAQVDTGTSVCL